jgi:hypothetical protein
MNVDSTCDLTSKDSERTKLPIVLDEAAVEDILGVILVLFNVHTFLVELSGSLNIVTRLKAGQLENQGLIMAARNFSLCHCSHTSSGAHPASCTVSTRGLTTTR